MRDTNRRPHLPDAERMKADFNQPYLADDRPPVDQAPQDFPWAVVFERLHQAEGLTSASPEQVEAISRLMDLLLTDAQGVRINPKAIGLRVLALAWVLRPSNFRDSPSLRALARRCGVSPATMARYTGEISRLTGIRNRPQRHAANWRPAERSARMYKA